MEKEQKIARCIQINLQNSLGGGETYTAAVGRAMAALGIPCSIIISKKAKFWGQLNCGGAELIPVENAEATPSLSFPDKRIYIVHSMLEGQQISALRGPDSFVVAFAHMPFHERSADSIRCADMVCAVSNYVRQTLADQGVDNLYPEPFYGISYTQRAVKSTGQLLRTTEFDWDKRKFRERVLSWISPVLEKLRPQTPYRKQPGLTIGLVSRITPIKQFPLMFSCLVPVLQDFPEVNIAIFGQGGYRSIRDLKKALAPLGDRVSFWGHQSDIQSVYRQIDWLMSGLPEKEALGLNIIEAQSMGVPVLAVDAPPFNETVVNQVTGLRFTDPRIDRAADFKEKLSAILKGQFARDEHQAQQHLSNFSEEAFAQRFRKLFETMRFAGKTAPQAKLGASRTQDCTGE